MGFIRGLLLVVLATLLIVSPGSGVSISGTSSSTAVVALHKASAKKLSFPLWCSNWMLKCEMLSKSFENQYVSISVKSLRCMPQVVALYDIIFLSLGCL